MKLIIQIPCYNEEKTLPLVVKSLPRTIKGIKKVEILVINDGSTDDTLKVARELGVEHILDFPGHRGLAEAFRRGLQKSLELGADIIVNTDGDNQYKGEDIPRLVEPVIEGKSEIVIGCRKIHKIKHFSPTKKFLQKVGSWVVRKFSNTDIPDTTSGFRAYSREAALRLNVFSTYTYTLETIIQAGRNEIPMSYITIETNKKLRESRLIKSIPRYVMRSVVTMARIYTMYEPLKTFFGLGMFFTAIGSIALVRFMIDHFIRSHGGHIQSVVIGSMCILVGAGCFVVGLLGDILSANRKMEEEILYRLRKKETGHS